MDAVRTIEHCNTWTARATGFTGTNTSTNSCLMNAPPTHLRGHWDMTDSLPLSGIDLIEPG
jgi:hypothetical protein